MADALAFVHDICLMPYEDMGARLIYRFARML